MSSDVLYEIFENTSGIFEIIPLIVLFITIKKLRTWLIPIAILVCISILTEVTNYIFSFYGTNNFIIFRTFTIIEMFLISFFYYKFYKQYFASFYFLMPLPLLIVVSVIDYYINGSEHFDNYATAFEAITFSIFSLWSFYYMLDKMIFPKLTDAPFFWINNAVLFYFGGNLILFIFDNYLISQEPKSHLAMWAIHSGLNIVYSIFISIGFWKTRRQ